MSEPIKLPPWSCELAWMEGEGTLTMDISQWNAVIERFTNRVKELEARVETSNRLELEAYRERDAALARVKELADRLRAVLVETDDIQQRQDNHEGAYIHLYRAVELLIEELTASASSEPAPSSDPSPRRPA